MAAYFKTDAAPIPWTNWPSTTGMVGREPPAGPARHRLLTGRGQFLPGPDGMVKQELP